MSSSTVRANLPWRRAAVANGGVRQYRPVMSCRLTALLALPALALRLDAQCPDGRQPPCTPPQATAPAPNTVAVLYFDARDTADAFLAEGMAEEIATSLGRVPRLTIKVPSAVRRAQTAHAGNARAVARALGVRWLVDGSVRRNG